MAENKKSFVLYSDLIKSIEHLTNEEKGILFNHLLEYVNDLNPVLTDRLILTAWKPIELQLKRDLIKFKEVKAKRSEAGKRSAELRAEKNEEKNSTKSTHVESVQQTSTNPTVNDNVTVNDTVNDTVILLEKETKEKKEILFSKNQIFGKELLEGQIWVETVSMQNKITPEEVPKWIDEFNKKLTSEFDTKVSKKEYASHFSRWLHQEINKSKTTISKIQDGNLIPKN